MGYYSKFDYKIEEGTTVDTVHIARLQKIIRESAQRIKKDTGMDIYGFHNVKFLADEHSALKEIAVEKECTKFYDSELFSYELSRCISSGAVTLYFAGEDGCRWGATVKPNEVIFF